MVATRSLPVSYHLSLLMKNRIGMLVCTGLDLMDFLGLDESGLTRKEGN
jgi:hypothetical protein